MNAKEAREATKAGMQRQIDLALEYIGDACREGEYILTLPSECNHAHVREALRALGYNVHMNRISWEK